MTPLPSPSERARLAALARINEAYLYQCLTGRRDMGALEAVRVEVATRRVLRRWDLCTRNWHLIWPELIARKGAPAVPAQQAQQAA